MSKHRPFVQRESYMHDAAKRVVAQWFRDSQTSGSTVRVGKVSARTSRMSGAHGVYLEYPIGDQGEGVDPCWDESFGYYDRDLSWVPSVDFLASRGIRVRCVCDVVLIHKGVASVAIEVVHKHPTPAWKRAFLAQQHIELIEVRAQAVLYLMSCPAKLPLYVARGGR